MRPPGTVRLTIVPCELDEANAFVRQYHRHHKAVACHRFSLAVADEEGQVRGVAIVGRPVARMDGGAVTAAHAYCRDITPALVGESRRVPVRIGGSGKVKITATAVSSSGVRENQQQVKARRAAAGSDTSSDGGASVRMARYSIAEACELQGFPPDFLADSPFTQAGRLKAIANAVARPTGRAIARGVRRAMGLSIVEHAHAVHP